MATKYEIFKQFRYPRMHMKLKNLSTTAEQLLQYVYILISLVINAQESFVRDSLKSLYWNLKGVGIGCPGKCLFCVECVQVYEGFTF